MLERAYSLKWHARRPTYVGCSVVPEWHRFMAFRAWVLEQSDWRGLQIDKDLLVPGNMEYGPTTCCFVSGRVNSLLNDSGSKRGCHPIGVHWNKSAKRFVAQVRDGYAPRT